MKVYGEPTRSIRSLDNGTAVEIVDQTLLPYRFEKRVLGDWRDCVEAIRTMRVRGAPLIGITGAWAVVLAVKENPENDALLKAAEVIANARPTAVNLSWAVRRMMSTLLPRDPALRFEAAVKTAEAMTQEDVMTCRAIGEAGMTLISDLYAARTGSLLWSENIVEINKQISDIASQERLLTQLKQQGSVNPDIFISRSNLLAERRRELKLQKERILRSEEDHTIQQTQDLLDVLESGPDWLDDFDEQLFSDMIEKIVVVDNETLRFRLLNGLEVTEKIERTRR